jgi:hypothetical protein
MERKGVKGNYGFSLFIFRVFSADFEGGSEGVMWWWPAMWWWQLMLNVGKGNVKEGEGT